MSGSLREKGRIPRGTLLRMGLLAALVLTGIALARFTSLGEWLSEERVLAFIQTLRRLWWAPVVLIALYAIVSVLALPPVPLLIGGAAFGPLYGTLYNTLGLTLGALLAYWEARFLGREFVVRITGDRLRRVESLFARHGFWPMVQTRFMPLPFSVVNFGAALAGVRPLFFMAASTVGLIPSTCIHTYFIAEAMTSHGRERALTLVLYGGAFLLFNVLLGLLWLRERAQRRRRHRQLVARRAARDGRG